MSEPLRIAMWSGPRNLSTALMYSFAARGDCAVWDEPFYAAYLKATGIAHPMKEAVIAAGITDPQEVARRCAGPAPGGQRLFYQKHMTLHMIAGVPLGFMAACTNVFLIRHPARVVASYAAKRENPSFEDLGFRQQEELFNREADRLGRAPIVIDSADIRADPEGKLAALCAAIGIGFTPAMLTWPAGPKPYDGVWAPHWYNAIHRSTGFDAAEGPLPLMEGEARRLADAGLPAFDRLRSFAL